MQHLWLFPVDPNGTIPHFENHLLHLCFTVRSRSWLRGIAIVITISDEKYQNLVIFNRDFHLGELESGKFKNSNILCRIAVRRRRPESAVSRRQVQQLRVPQQAAGQFLRPEVSLPVQLSIEGREYGTVTGLPKVGSRFSCRLGGGER